MALIVILLTIYLISLKPTLKLAQIIRSYTHDRSASELTKELNTLIARRDELGDLANDINEMISRNEQYMSQQLENESLKSKILLAQIKPHFIYNSLAAIRSKMDEPPKAEESLNHFTSFLRGSVDILEEPGCINAEREFKTVDDYIYIEKERFGDLVCFQKDYKDKDFSLPPFTLQILVENAIKHGIRANEGQEGTVNIRSYETEDFHVIEVEDNGVGMSETITPEDKSDDGLHVGLNNIENRLKLMCNGTLTIESEIGKGTTVTIRIPKESDSVESS
ncbi:MAG: histidine kinase [Lachnospiraceae bacterium]|nr:histidine kinase [Lachnospiraceae bacterium]